MFRNLPRGGVFLAREGGIDGEPMGPCAARNLLNWSIDWFI